jgi:hypothetical protein
VNEQEAGGLALSPFVEEKMTGLLLHDVAADLTAIKNLLIPDILAWGAACIGLGLTASAVLWVMRIVRSS